MIGKAYHNFLVSPHFRLAALLLLAILSGTLFMTIGVHGNWGFILEFRGTKLATMIVVGAAIGTSTVVFQSLAQNRILTPSIMGFDSLYMLIQSLLIFLLGLATVASMPVSLRFSLEAGTLTLFSAVLYRVLFSGGSRGLHLLILVGIVFGILFRSLSGFLKWLIDPTAFTVVQDRMFASFNRPDPDTLMISAGTTVVIFLMAWRVLPVLDVLALGRDQSTSLGLNHRRAATVGLMAVSVLVAVSTALVGPMLFLGLLAAHLAYLVIPSHRHALLLPAAALTATLCLIVGQTMLEHVLSYNTALGVVIEFVGGLFFLILLLRGRLQ
jgi:iron complex transport system permease protein